MHIPHTQREVALAAVAALAALGAVAFSAAPVPAVAQSSVAGKYVAGDFHNHTTCSDGSLSVQKLVKKATVTWGLDWFVQAGHGGNGNRNCTLTEDASLATPGYAFTNQGPTTTWAGSLPNGNADLKGSNTALTGGVIVSSPTTAPSVTGLMWRWQSLQSFQYPLMENLAANNNVPLFLGLESVVAGHEHTSMSVITGQMPATMDTATITGPNTVLGNANALAQWSYCFDRGDTDNSRGTTNAWNCSVTGSLNAADPSWNATGQKLIPAGTTTFGSALGTKGHNKTVEAVKWMAANHPTGSYYIPAHLERAGQFNADGNFGFNVESLRDFNNAGPDIAFGFETQPGHGASSNRGEYQVRRNGGFPTAPGTTITVDSVGGTTYGGTGVYGAQIGGVWDALLGEGRNFWFFASSDWHNRGIFNNDDRRSTQDFQPGEYQRTYAMVRNGSDKLRPQTIVDGLRSGNAFASSGQLIDRLSFIACTGLTPAQVQALAVTSASNNTAVNAAGCVNMGERLTVSPGTTVTVAIVARDPAGANNSPYTFPNPSLLQVGITQPMNLPVLDHIDLIGGLVTGRKAPGAADYAGQWPINTDWLRADGTNPRLPNGKIDLSGVPAAAKNTSADILSVFNGASWTPVVVGGAPAVAMTYAITATASQYVRLRGTNLPAGVPSETDSFGNPLSDLYTNANDTTKLTIRCTTVGNNVPPLGGRLPYTGNAIDGCPTHLPVVGGVKYVAYDVAAWADLWFYSNPIYIQVGAAAGKQRQFASASTSAGTFSRMR